MTERCMRRGRPTWTNRLGDALKRRVEDRVDAHDRTPRQLYNELNLCRFAGFRTFRGWVTERRRKQRREGAEPAREKAPMNCGAVDSGPSVVPVCVPSSYSSSAVDMAIAGCVEAITEALLAGRIGKLDLGKALRSLKDLKTLGIEQDVNRRAEEKHAAWKAEQAAQQATALESVTQTSQLTPEQVAEIRLKVLGL